MKQLYDIAVDIKNLIVGGVTAVIAQLPAALGPHPAANSVSVVPATGATFTVAGLTSLGMPVATRSVAATGPILDSDGQVFVDATAGAVTMTLPTAVGRTGRPFWITCVNAAGGFVTLASAGGTINGAATYVMGYNESVLVVSDGTNWRIVAGYVG